MRNAITIDLANTINGIAAHTVMCTATARGMAITTQAPNATSLAARILGIAMITSFETTSVATTDSRSCRAHGRPYGTVMWLARRHGDGQQQKTFNAYPNGKITEPYRRTVAGALLPH